MMTGSSGNKSRAIFFDRDGVLNVDKAYVYRSQDFEWVEGAREAIKLANDLGFKTFVVTNQSGIARGCYTLNDMHALHNWMQHELSLSGARIDHFYFCPYHEVGEVAEYVVPNHPDRKPNPGMILRAIEEFDLSPRHSLLIGDKASDMEAARCAGVSGLLYQGGSVLELVQHWISQQ